MARLSSLVNSFARYRRERGLKSALVKMFHFLRIGAEYLRIEYPVTGTHFTVSADPFWEKLAHGLWEPDCIKHVLGMVKTGSIVLDVGAWIGLYTLMFGTLVQDTGQVYAFEPDPRARRVLLRNVKKNGLANVTIIQFALSNARGKSRLYSYSEWGDSMANIIGRQNKSAASFWVKTTTIDQFCRERRIRPDGIKLDVEGAEALVMEGARNVVRECAPWVLLEFHGQFMSPEERRRNWDSIVSSAKKVTFLAGRSELYSYGSEVVSMPDCPYCHIFIQF